KGVKRAMDPFASFPKTRKHRPGDLEMARFGALAEGEKNGIGPEDGLAQLCDLVMGSEALQKKRAVLKGLIGLYRSAHVGAVGYAPTAEQRMLIEPILECVKFHKTVPSLYANDRSEKRLDFLERFSGQMREDPLLGLRLLEIMPWEYVYGEPIFGDRRH